VGLSYHAYLNTRVTIFAQRLLDRRELERLVDLGDSVARGTTGNENLDLYLEILATTPPHPEQELLERQIGDFQVLLRPVSGSDRDFLSFAVRWFELANLKALIRGKFANLSPQEIEAQLLDMGPFTRLPLKELLEAEDPMEMLRRLEQTSYAAIVRQARRVYEEEQELFSLDAAIDRRFFIGLAQRAKSVSTGERRPMAEVVGSLLDRFNLLWLLRYRFAYGFPPAKTYYLLAATGRRLNADILLSLAKLESVEAVIERLPEALRERIEGLESITEIESRLEQENWEVAKRALKDQAHPVTRTFAYFVLREGESRNVLAILKGRRLGFPSDMVRFAVGLEA
jgi:V/A-type H+-transporting ATPase subunit C